MSARTLWLPNTDGVTTEYELWSSPDNLAYTLLATIPHDLEDPLVYDHVTGQFFYNDVGGTATTWYKVRAHDGAGGYSDFGPARRPDPPVPPTCLVWGRVLNFDGEAQAGVQVKVHVELTKRDQSGQFVGAIGVNQQDVEVFTDADGDWEARLLQGGEAVIQIPDANFTKTFTVPAQSAADLMDLV